MVKQGKAIKRGVILLIVAMMLGVLAACGTTEVIVEKEVQVDRIVEVIKEVPIIEKEIIEKEII